MMMTWQHTWAVFWLLISSVFWQSAIAEQVWQGIDIEVKDINTQQALELYQRGAVFIDVRSEEDWLLGHIRNAIHMDIKREFNDLYRIETIDRNKEIVIYCNSTQCSRSSVASFIASAWGFNNVYRYGEGYFGWLAADLPTRMVNEMHTTLSALEKINVWGHKVISRSSVISQGVGPQGVVPQGVGPGPQDVVTEDLMFEDMNNYSQLEEAQISNPFIF